MLSYPKNSRNSIGFGKEMALVVADDRLLRISEVQEILRLTRWTVLDWIERGYLREVRLPSGQRRIRQSEIERALAGGASEREKVTV